MDKYLPSSIGSYSRRDTDMWIPYLEKAYAKFLGSYAALDGGCPLDAALHFSGGFSQSYELSKYQTEDQIQELFQCLISATTKCSKSSIVTCSTYNFGDEKGEKSGVTKRQLFLLRLDQATQPLMLSDFESILNMVY
mgnify:CR=1 FL=1